MIMETEEIILLATLWLFQNLPVMSATFLLVSLAGVCGLQHAPVLRREALSFGAKAAATAALGSGAVARARAADAEPTVTALAAELAAARAQLEPCAKLIRDGKWDSVRAILITPPVADVWAKSGRDLGRRLARALGDDGGAALVAREDAVSHLQFLDMAVYNNNFVGEGERINGTPVDYKMPLAELAASKAALDELLEASGVAPPDAP